MQMAMSPTSMGMSRCLNAATNVMDATCHISLVDAGTRSLRDDGATSARRTCKGSGNHRHEFGRTCPSLPQEDENRCSLEDALGRVGAAPFLLDLRRAREVPLLTSWLTRLQSMRANFTTHILVSPQDALVFVDPLTPTGK